MDVSNHAFLVHQTLGRHTAELEDFYLLPKQIKHRVLGIGKTDERHLLFLPILPEFIGFFRAHYDNLNIPIYKHLVLLTQLRHVPTAVRSYKPSVKYEKHIFMISVASQLNFFAGKIF